MELVTNKKFNFFKRHSNKFPLSLFKLSKKIAEIKERDIYKDFENPNISLEDELKITNIIITQVIPVESFHTFIENFRFFIINHQYKDDNNFFQFQRLESHKFFFNNIGNHSGSSVNIGSYKVKGFYQSCKFWCGATKFTDSLISVSFNLSLSDAVKRDFYFLIRKEFSPDPLITNFSYTDIFNKSIPIMINSPSQVLKDQIDTFKENIINNITSFLIKNNLYFHIGESNSLSSIFFYLFTRNKKYSKNDRPRNCFWDLLNFPNIDSQIYADKKKMFHIPDCLKEKTVLDIYLSELNLLNEFNEKNVENAIYLLNYELQVGCYTPIALNKLLSSFYEIVNQYRHQNIRKNQSVRKQLNINNDYKNIGNWIEIIKSEYDHRILKYNVKKHTTRPFIKRFDKKIFYFDMIASCIKWNINKLKLLNKTIDRNLSRKRDELLTKSNQKIQVVLIILTSATVILGVLQLLL